MQNHTFQFSELLAHEAASIQCAARRFQSEQLERALDLLVGCENKVIVTVIGKSAFIGRKIAATMTSTGTRAVFLHPSDALHGDISILHSSDVIWKYPNHPYGEVWFKYFNEARAAGYITSRDLELSMIRSYIRFDLLNGNFAHPIASESFARLSNAYTSSDFARDSVVGKAGQIVNPSTTTVRVNCSPQLLNSYSRLTYVIMSTPRLLVPVTTTRYLTATIKLSIHHVAQMLVHTEGHDPMQL